VERLLLGKYNVRNLDSLFNPKTVAVIGAGTNLNKVGGQAILHLIMGKYQGNLYPVNPKGGTVLNHEIIPSLKQIPGDIDLAILAIPQSLIFSAVEECMEENVKFLIIHTAGFQETAAFDGKWSTIEGEFKRLLNKNRNTRIVGPNCMGIASTSSNLNALMGINLIPSGKDGLNLSVASQSGSAAAISMRAAIKHDLGISRVVSTGNELDLNLEDFLEYFGLYDDTTQVIGLFIEQLRKGPEFLRITSEIKKPIIVIKAGKTDAGAKASLSHTGSLSSSSKLYGSVFKQAGVIEVNSLPELVDFARAFAIYMKMNIMPKGKRVGIYTVGGGAGVLTTDRCAEQGLDVVPLSEDTKAKLDKLLPSIWSHINPIDLIATRDFTTTEKVLKIMINAEEFDMIIPIIPLGIDLQMGKLETIEGIPPTIEEFNKKMLKAYHKSLMDHLLKLVKVSKKPIIVPCPIYSTDMPFQYDDISTLYNAGVCVVNNVDMTTRILAKLYDFVDRQERKKNRELSIGT